MFIELSRLGWHCRNIELWTPFPQAKLGAGGTCLLTVAFGPLESLVIGDLHDHPRDLYTVK